MTGKRKRYAAEFKAKVAMEALRGELTASQLATKHGVHQTMIGDWKRQAMKGARPSRLRVAPALGISPTAAWRGIRKRAHSLPAPSGSPRLVGAENLNLGHRCHSSHRHSDRLWADPTAAPSLASLAEAECNE
jgi:hypothetical protein